MCPLKGESANCLSAFQSVIYESLTSDSPGKVNSSVNQSCPLISVSVNQRVDCSILRKMLFALNTTKINLDYGVFSKIFWAVFLLETSEWLLILQSSVLIIAVINHVFTNVTQIFSFYPSPALTENNRKTSGFLMFAQGIKVQQNIPVIFFSTNLT